MPSVVKTAATEERANNAIYLIDVVNFLNLSAGPKERVKTRRAYVGTWRLTEMSNWDKDFIDLVAHGHIQLKPDGTGTLLFRAIEAKMDCRIERHEAGERLAFSFAGWDEGDDASGRGWAEIHGNE